jgi:hypothetical protein
MSGYWRKRAREVIIEVLADCEKPQSEADIKAIKAKLLDNYPFVYRGGWPYKVWLDECKRHLNQLQGLPNTQKARDRQKLQFEAEGQLSLF